MTKDMMIGVDLAKAAFQIHVATMSGQVVVRRKLSRSQFRTFVAEQTPAVVVMEACGSAHYWHHHTGQRRLKGRNQRPDRSLRSITCLKGQKLLALRAATTEVVHLEVLSAIAAGRMRGSIPWNFI